MKAQSQWLPTLDTAAVACQSKSADDIIRSATFPAAHAPSLDDSSRSEGGQWPCSLAALGTVGSRQACRHCYLLPGGREATHHYLSLLISTLSLWQKLNCIPASTPELFGRHCILFFAVCLHKIMEPQT